MFSIKNRNHNYISRRISTIKASLRFGLYTSFLLIFIVIIIISFFLRFSVLLPPKAHALLHEMPKGLHSVALIIYQELLCLSFMNLIAILLLVLWYGILACIFLDIWSIFIVFILKKARLRTKEYEKYIIMQKRRSYQGRIISIFLLSLLAIGTIIITLKKLPGYITALLGFIILAILVIALYLIKYINDWRTIKVKHPRLLRIIYGRRNSIGDFFLFWSLLIILVLLLRFVSPVLFELANFISERFLNTAKTIIDSPNAQKVQIFLLTTKNRNFTDYFPILEIFSIKELLARIINHMKIDPLHFKRMVFSYLYWIGIMMSFCLLLIPMILYNMTLKNRRVLKKCFQATFLSIFVGLVFQYGFSFVFLIPSPRIECTGLVFMLVFSTYVTWIYTK